MIKINSITISFNAHAIVRDFSMSVTQGQKIAICGDSGSGKTSILKTLLGFIIPEKGTIHIDDIHLTAGSVWHLRNLIGYVAQEPDLGTGTVQHIIDAPFAYKANHHFKVNSDQIKNLLDQFSLSDSILSKDIASVSGGEKQRIALIIALLLKRPILLLDEISSALDQTCKQAAIDLLSKSDQTVILITHDQALKDVCDRTVFIQAPDTGGRS